MKLVVGMGSIDDFEDFAKAGADEVFVGYVPAAWQEKYGFANPLNRREVCFVNTQIGSFSELMILKNMVEKYKVKVTIAFNGLNFTNEQYPVIADIIKEVLSLGFQDVIIADFGLLVYLNQTGLVDKLKIHISGEFGEINHLLLGELVGLGASRLIFHRKVSFENMAKIIPYFPIEYEAFIMNENCHFNGAYCNSLHCDELVPMCRMPYEIDTPLEDACKDNQECQGYDYGLSRIKQLADIGITHLKIVGRGAPSDFMVKCIEECHKFL